MDRRAFLRGMAGILAYGIAPAVVSSGVLMPVRRIITPLFGGEVGSWNGVRIEKIQWSHDGVAWTDAEQVLKHDPEPAYVWSREWVTVKELERLYPPNPM